MFTRIFLLLLITFSAQAEKVFVALKGGLVFPKNTSARNEQGQKITDMSLDGGISFGLEVGYKKDYWRTSLTGHIRKDTDLILGVVPNGDIEPLTGSFENLAVFANGYLDLQSFIDSGKLNPFLHLGIGYSKTKIDSLLIPGTGFIARGDFDTGFGWTIGAGLGWWFKDNLALEVEYAVSDLGDWQTKMAPNTGRESGEYESTDFLISLRFDFNEFQGQSPF
jgi:opacity protein-like surface antigen